jgi:uncharacterized protein (DUF4415 family)
MPKLQPGTIMPTTAEDAAFNAGIVADPDTYELGAVECKKLRAAPGRPKAEITKEKISIRLSPDVVKAFRSTGEGWQTRIDEALKTYLREHKAA